VKYALANQAGREVGDLIETGGKLSTNSVDRLVLNKVKFLNDLKERDLWSDLDMNTFLSYQCGTGGNSYNSIQVTEKQ
jgi:hypothetical protein